MECKIEFRGKALESGKWVYGDILRIAGGCLIYFGNNNETFQPDIPKESNVAVELMQSEVAVVDPETVGQFTGFRDRVGAEIYEGDLIEYCSGVDSFGAIWQTVRIEYRTNEGGYVGINQYRQTRDGREIVQNIVRCLNKCIVRGNIHDNPELLK